MPDLFSTEEFTPADKLKAVTREIGQRKFVYPRRVAAAIAQPSPLPNNSPVKHGDER